MYKSGEIDSVLSHRLSKVNNSESKSSHIHQHQENVPGILSTDNEPTTSKPNQVGTVMLYGVPIVSLHIESQERLCLAQISNTLLKQFSYNEIHNRRVALGITCVQCTPVQLEILRRAGAMPVSSRRCGMITRREAERLCKSFLGDNAPPRLPDDFSFSVYHECAWGCRGQFLPSRYNSSRAKCIKCSYCGLFFSPNKFIFHSHRIGPGDKYVQPDAANFNSWRRHMKLSGVSPDEIVYAWEDVKAMFNGGTRKRLISSVSSASAARASSPDTIRSSAASSSHRNSLITTNITNVHLEQSEQSPKRLKESNASENQTQPLSPPLMAVAAAVAAAANAGHQYPIRPMNVHSTKLPNANCSRLMNSTSICSNPVPRGANSIPTDIAPSIQLSRNFVMDYMWQQQQHHSAYGLPWLKQPAHIFFNHQTFHHNHQHNSLNTLPSSQVDGDNDKSTLNRRNSSDRIVSPTVKPYSPNATAMPYYKNSAFKPVLGTHRAQLFNENVFNSSLLGASVSPVQNNRIDEPNESNFNNENELKNRSKRYNHRRSDGGNSASDTIRDTITSVPVESVSSDEEMVDIETTEEHSLASHPPMQRCISNHSNSSLLNDNCDATIENGSSIHTSDADILKKLNSGHCGNNNNNILNNNNNNNNTNNNNTIHKIHKSDSNNIELHKSGQPCSDLKQTANVMCSVQNRSDENAVIRHEIDVEGDDLNENDTHSTKSNFSNIDVEIEKDERKPNLKSFSGVMPSLTNDSNSWISNSPEKLTAESNLIYSNCDGDTTTSHTSSMATNLKKELKTSYPFNSAEDDLVKTTKSSVALDLSKMDESHESNDLNYSPTAGTSYEKSDLKWRSSPKASSPPQLNIDGKFQKSSISHINPIATTSPPFTAASTANILLSNRMNQFYPRPSLTSFHNPAQQHSISKHFHHMLNQHTNFLQNSSLAFDRTALSGSLNLSTGYNHSHQDVITSATAQPHHLHQS
ncbi:probable cyclin-dependent serine/threonine-protein kinase DDB_G0292550 [Contarinia nasturtii]|uniref:probable cyclin-dependent serine/threonine-protein kinase DDB_G0292550 n=1 Tax=Contarinia nasturtii TaxID=265458 RepID=UPI0012D3E200|nr:probable cyclin-dependent serine/threonine-protein kinase DDB_G0292550 [Contarinia nasturtii]